MSSPTINQNQVTNEVDLIDVLNLLKKQIALDMVCHHIGTIQSFNSSNQTCTATINYKKTIFTQDQTTKLYQPTQLSYPVLIDCPVIFLGGGASNLTFPINKGDECLLIFNDRDIDNWFSGLSGGAVATPRLHSFSDAIALVGLRSSPNVIKSFDTARAVLKNTNAYVGVGTDKIKLANSVTTLNTLLQELTTELTDLTAQLSALTVTGVTSGSSASGVPSNASAITAIGSRISATASKIGGLLE